MRRETFKQLINFGAGRQFSVSKAHQRKANNRKWFDREMDNKQKYLRISWSLGKIKNPNFNYPEFGVIGQEAGTNRFMMSVGQWIDRTKAIGMLVKSGRYGGTYTHKDIAFHFAMWLSPEFQIYLVNEFQRLKR